MLVMPSGTMNCCSPPVKLKVFVVAALDVAPLAPESETHSPAARTIAAAIVAAAPRRT
jgi:hypothetical protein